MYVAFGVFVNEFFLLTEREFRRIATITVQSSVLGRSAYRLHFSQEPTEHSLHDRYRQPSPLLVI